MGHHLMSGNRHIGVEELDSNGHREPCGKLNVTAEIGQDRPARANDGAGVDRFIAPQTVAVER